MSKRQNTSNESSENYIQREKLWFLLISPILIVSLSLTVLSSIGFDIKNIEYWFGTLSVTIGTSSYLLKNKYCSLINHDD